MLSTRTTSVLRAAQPMLFGIVETYGPARSDRSCLTTIVQVTPAIDILRNSAMTITKPLAAATRQSERTILLGSVLLISGFSAAIGFVLTQYFAVDVLTSLIYFPEDCFRDWGAQIGRHCFSDYAVVVGAGMRSNPWEPYTLLPPNRPLTMEYPASALLPPLVFGVPAKLLGAPVFGLIAYMLALAAAVISPAVWAVRGARGLDSAVIFVGLSAAAIPVWMVIDRGNTVGFVVPIALIFLIALYRQRWGMVTTMAVLATLIKPQFALLIVALFVARQWRLGSAAIAGVILSNIAAYLVWPSAFPGTIPRSIGNLLNTRSFSALTDVRNVSFGRAFFLIPDTAKMSQVGGKLPEGFLVNLRSPISYAIMILIVASLLALGRRLPPVVVGIVLLATGALFPPVAAYYYLVFVLPIAALIVRDPDGPSGSGIFDRLLAGGIRRRAVGMSVSIATALSIAQTVRPGSPITVEIYGGVSRALVGTTTFVTPYLWLFACVVIIVSYARRPDSVNNEYPVSAQGKDQEDDICSRPSSSDSIMKSSAQESASSTED